MWFIRSGGARCPNWAGSTTAAGAVSAPAALQGIHPDRTRPTATASDRLAYDDNGNVVRLNDLELNWDFKDRLITVKSDRSRAEYIYDHADRRVAKHVADTGSSPGAPTVVHYVGEHYEVRDSTPVKYVYAGQRRIARIDRPLSRETDATTPSPSLRPTIRHIHQDHLGSTNVVSDAAGHLVEEVAYYPYGYPRYVHRQTAVESEPYKFSQKELDKETGLQYFEARYLDGPLARFLSVDPALQRPLKGSLEDPQRLNAYSYSLNRPLVYGDPNGEAPHLLVGGVSSVLMGFALAKITGSDYGLTSAAADFAMGALGVGVVSKLKAMKTLRKVRRFANRSQLTPKHANKHVQSWHPKGDIDLSIRFTPSKNVPGRLSQYPRYSLRTSQGARAGRSRILQSEYTNLETGMRELGKDTFTYHSPLNRLRDTPIDLWKTNPDVPRSIMEIGAGAADLS